MSTTPLSGNGTVGHAIAHDGHGRRGRAEWLDVDWRGHQRWVVVDGQPVNTIELGEGEPIVFVHGLSGVWSNWLEQLPRFARDHRVLTLDLPGFGHSPMPAEEISISAYARLLDGVLEERGIDRAAVVGNSMGGLIAAELAISFPERVDRLVLVSPAGISTSGDVRLAHGPLALQQTLAAAAMWLAANADAVTRRPRSRDAVLKFIAAHPRRLPAALAAEQLRGGGKPGFFGALEAVISHDLRGHLPEISCPTLIVWGTRDLLIPVRDADVFAELIGDSRKVVYEDTGHVAMLERPAEFNSLLADFLAE